MLDGTPADQPRPRQGYQLGPEDTMTMTITAKFASRCGSCGQPVTPGQKIEWTKGAPVRHTVCGGSTPSNVVKVTPAA